MGIKFPQFSLEVPGAPDREKTLENNDLLPVPLEKRTWGFWTYTIFWFSAVGTVANWLGGGTFLTFGITVWEGILCQFFGFAITGLLMALNGRAGSVYHISFPVYSRASFGVYGAMWPVFNRALSACVWSGVNSVTGGQCVYILLHSIFPSITRIPNKMPASSALDSAGMLGFFLFVGMTAAVSFMAIPKWPILIKVKLVAYFLSCVGMLAMALTASGGVGDTLTAPSTVHGSDKAWLIVRFLLLATASCATFVSNAADWQRNATHPKDPIFGQIFGFPMSNFITTLIGMIVAASSPRYAGEIIWNPLVYLDLILTDNYDAKHRAGAFFVSLGFLYSSVFSSVFENIYPAGNDIASLAPKYLTVKRGFAICYIVTIAMNPWYLLGSAGIFISFIASYQIFLFSISGILLVDYYLIQKGKLHLDWLYTADRQGPYWYTYGVNWRAMVAYVVGAAVNFAGFLDNMGVKGFSTSLQRSFYFAFITTLAASGVTYYLLARLFPQPSYLMHKDEPKKFEEWSQEKVEGFAAGKGEWARDGVVGQDQVRFSSSGSGGGSPEEVDPDAYEKFGEALGDGKTSPKGAKGDKVTVAVLDA